jgi:glycosyltransferase involved in cell wall biosynthesis
MNNNPLISIIVPVYNGEKYLRPCIDSILAQTYQDWELLLMDDGSTDGSAAICDEYAERDNITVVHKQNEGQAIARNEGLKLAKGEYVSFIDCDDWLAPEMYAVLMECIARQQCQIAVCGFFEEYATFRKEVHNDGAVEVFDGQEAAKRILQGKIGSYLWSMLFRRDVLVEPIPNLRYYEDHAVIFKWMLHAGKVAVLHRALYHYRQLQGSSLHRSNPEKERQYFTAIKERYYYIRAHNPFPGWEAENRRLYVRGCIKLAKDVARSQDFGAQQQQLITEIRDEIGVFLPVSKQEVGLKNLIRLRLLLANANLFVSILRLSSVFTAFKRRKPSNLFKAI